MKSELLAPAGDFSSLYAAVNAGADAVYIGASKFSARANAVNFNSEQLAEAIEYCRIRGVKAYLAINTLIKDSELSEALKVAMEAYEAGIDGYIVQDLGLMKLLKEKFDTEVHASTQMTVFDEYGLEFLKKRGICRAVLARECEREEIVRLCEKNITESEVFCHGAICMSYSGQCLMSSMLGGRSANRGACAQPCRLCYTADGDKGYYLSPRDLCLADEVDFLSKAGVASLKIEGRMKGPAYVAAAVRAYRRALDEGRMSEEDGARLVKAFARGGSFTKGCYGSVKGRAMMNVESSNDNVMRSSDRELEKELEMLWKGGEIKKLPVKAELYIGGVTRITLSDGINSVSEECETPTEEYGKKTDVEFARACLSKMGATPFYIEEFSYTEKVNAYFKASELNELRRKAVLKLMKARSGKRSFDSGLDFSVKPRKKENTETYISASVETRAQAEALIKAGARVYVPYGLGSFEGAAGAIIPAVYKKLPKKLDCSVVVAGSIGAAEYARGLGKSVIADYSMNIFNSVSAEEFETVTLSTELTLAEMKKITASFNTEAVVYGYIPLMKTKNCIIKTVGKCAGSCADCRKSIKLRDRKNAVFTVKSDGEFNTLYNSVPLFMADRINELKDAGFTGLRLCFTNESPREAVKIYKMYAGEAAIEKPSAYTRGHFYSGV